MLTITVSPTTPGRFAATHDGRVLVASSPTPLLAAARVLAAEGVDPATELAMLHAGRDVVAMRGRLDRLAGLTVRETPTEGPYFTAYSAPEPETPILTEGAPRQRPATPTLAHASPEPERHS